MARLTPATPSLPAFQDIEAEAALDKIASPAYNASTTAAAASLVVKASSGVLMGMSVTNNNNAAQYIQIHDAAALPTDGAVPALSLTVPATTSFGIDFGTTGRSFVNGIVVCNSSTFATKTIGSANCWFDVQYL
jgi:hypothetical protein